MTVRRPLGVAFGALYRVGPFGQGPIIGDLLGILTVVLLTSATSNAQPDCVRWTWSENGALAMLAFWRALIVGVVLLARGLGGGGRARWGVSATEQSRPARRLSFAVGAGPDTPKVIAPRLGPSQR